MGYLKKSMQNPSGFFKITHVKCFNILAFTHVPFFTKRYHYSQTNTTPQPPHTTPYDTTVLLPSSFSSRDFVNPTTNTSTIITSKAFSARHCPSSHAIAYFPYAPSLLLLFSSPFSMSGSVSHRPPCQLQVNYVSHLHHPCQLFIVYFFFVFMGRYMIYHKYFFVLI